jgi:hypothetical protein
MGSPNKKAAGVACGSGQSSLGRSIERPYNRSAGGIREGNDEKPPIIPTHNIACATRFM